MKPIDNFKGSALEVNIFSKSSPLNAVSWVPSRFLKKSKAKTFHTGPVLKF